MFAYLRPKIRVFAGQTLAGASRGLFRVVDDCDVVRFGSAKHKDSKGGETTGIYIL